MAPNVLQMSTYGNFVSTMERCIARSSIQLLEIISKLHCWYGHHASPCAMTLWDLPHAKHPTKIFQRIS
jgi:hypothetical protein